MSIRMPSNDRTNKCARNQRSQSIIDNTNDNILYDDIDDNDENKDSMNNNKDKKKIIIHMIMIMTGIMTTKYMVVEALSLHNYAFPKQLIWLHDSGSMTLAS